MADGQMRQCGECGRTLAVAMFSAKQLKKAATKRKCKECVDGVCNKVVEEAPDTTTTLAAGERRYVAPVTIMKIPLAYDVIREDRRVGELTTCDETAAVLFQVAAPAGSAKQLAKRLAAQPKDFPVGHCGGTGVTRKLVWFSLDAVCHHFLLEWHQGQGWRLLQSYLHPDFERGVNVIPGYAATEWVAGRRGDGDADKTTTTPCGTYDTTTWHRFGGGRLLTDADAVEIVDNARKIMCLGDSLLADVLLPQLPASVRPGPRPKLSQRTKLAAYDQKVSDLVSWAADLIAEAEHNGLTEIDRPGHGVDIVLGSLRNPNSLRTLFTVPKDRADAMHKAYSTLCGERLPPFVYLRLFNQGVAHDRIYDPQGNAFGYGVRFAAWA